MISNGIVLVFSVLGSMKPSAGPSGSPVWTTKPSAAANARELLSLVKTQVNSKFEIIT